MVIYFYCNLSYEYETCREYRRDRKRGGFLVISRPHGSWTYQWGVLPGFTWGWKFWGEIWHPDLNVPGHSVLRGSSLAFLLALTSPWHHDQLLGPKGRARVEKNNSHREAVNASSGHVSIDCRVPLRFFWGLLLDHLLKLSSGSILDQSEEADMQCWTSCSCSLVISGYSSCSRLI